VLRRELRRDLADVVRRDAEPLWEMVRYADGPLAAIDGFYLLERQRGLTRIASAADLWNPAYAPFGHSLFCEAALGYLGAQNRGEGLHREIIFGNAPMLAALERSDGGDCLPLSRARNSTALAVSTGRHLAGRAIGGRLRAAWKGGRTAPPPRTSIAVDSLDAVGIYDPSALRRVLSGPSEADGAGNIVAIAYATTGSPQEVTRFLGADMMFAGAPVAPALPGRR
jgi:hypothetical protein